ncbi:18492_t:CDS:2 [Gigaspora rosea]|nr:18492_t:CDS:2 [Gigaspora rosea]
MMKKNDERFFKIQKMTRASEIAKVPKIQSIINEVIQTITKKKEFVIVGHDTTTKILPDAEIKLVLDAEIETKLYQRSKQILDIECEVRMNPKESSSRYNNIESTVEELIDYENWQITNYVSDKAFIYIFPDLEKRYEFISNLLEFHQKCLENYEHIERDILPKNRQDDLFRDAQDWRKNVLNGPKHGTRFQISQLEKSLKDLENKIDEFYENQKKNSEQKNNNE